MGKYLFFPQKIFFRLLKHYKHVFFFFLSDCENVTKIKKSLHLQINYISKQKEFSCTSAHVVKIKLRQEIPHPYRILLLRIYSIMQAYGCVYIHQSPY